MWTAFPQYGVNMRVYGLHISDDRGLTNIDLYRYAQQLWIHIFRGVFMQNTLPKVVHYKECVVVKFQHFTCGRESLGYAILRME